MKLQQQQLLSVASRTKHCKALCSAHSAKETCLVEGMAQAAHLVPFLEDQWLHPLAAMHNLW